AFEDPIVAALARGEGSFSAAGVDMASLLLAPEQAAISEALGRLAAYDRYRPIAVAAEEERRLDAIASLDRALGVLGLGVGPDGDLPGAASIIAAAFASGADASEAFAAIYAAVDSAAAACPGWMANELVAWRSAVFDYAALRGLSLGLPTPVPSSKISEAIADHRARASRLHAILSSVTRPGGDAVEALFEAQSDPSWSGAELEAIRCQAVGLMAGSLAASVGNLGESPDWDSVADDLLAAAEALYARAPGTLKNRAVSEALGSLKRDDAILYERDPGTLSGRPLELRLAALWSTVDPEEISEAALAAANRTARVAYEMRTLVFEGLDALDSKAARSDLLKLTLRGPAGESSWLDGYYDSEGQDAGSEMERLLGIALGDEEDPWTVGLARTRVGEEARASLSLAAAYRDRLRSDMAGASAPAERSLAAAIASISPDAGYLSWAVSTLGLVSSEGLGYVVGDHAVDFIAEGFLGLADGRYAEHAAVHYIAALALSGRLESFEAAAARASAASAERGRSILGMARLRATYAGEFSGEACSWALRASGGDVQGAIGLVRYLESGVLDDALAQAAGPARFPSEPGDPFYRWFVGALSGKAEALESAARKDAALLSYSISAERAAAAQDSSAAGGERHWREFLRGAALTEACSQAPADDRPPLPGEPGDPEADPLSVPKAAASWIEGSLADASEAAFGRTMALREALASWGGFDSSIAPAPEAFADFFSACQRYISDPRALFDSSAIVLAPAVASREYAEALSERSGLEYRRRLVASEIARLGAAYDIVSDTNAVEARLDGLSSQTKTARDSSDAAMARYEEAATAFRTAGESYDRAYAETKARFSSLESSRYELEKEDAIRRWASTAYLGSEESEISGSPYRSPSEELSYAESSSARATMARSALEGLYDEGEEGRAFLEPEYRAAYDEYKETYRGAMLAAKARDALAGALRNEYRLNQVAYDDYMKSYGTIRAERPASSFDAYLRIDTGGRLRLAYGAGFAFEEA
ncbi:MAG: hypothetical protein KKB59_00005, partial [Spirochaetes bacterium]|nr:hypothetical protein [Spirochaetota bacterium]